MFISFKLFSLLHTHHFSCHGVLSTGDWHLIHESENSLPENLDGLQTEILSLQVSQGTWKYLLDAYPLRIGAQFNTAQNCVYFVDHVFAASRLFRFPTRIPSFSCLSATHATCINRTNGPVAVAQTDRTKHRQTLGGRGSNHHYALPPFGRNLSRRKRNVIRWAFITTGQKGVHYC